MICDECGSDRIKDGTCTNCGLVMVSHPISFSHPKIIRNRKTKEKEQIGEYYTKISPDIRYMHEGNKKYYKKNTGEYKYLKAYFDIKKFCSILDVPKIILRESLRLYKEIRKKDENFFVVNGLEPSYLAFLYISSKIHNFYIPKSKITDLCNTKYNDIKKFNSAYYGTMEKLDIHIEKEKHPVFIPYACQKLNYDSEFCNGIQKLYSSLKKYFNNTYKIEGYVLSLIYILKGDITIHEISEQFEISPSTISSRKNEIGKIIKMNLNEIILKLRSMYKEKGKKNAEPMMFHKDFDGERTMVIVGIGSPKEFIKNILKKFKRLSL